MTISIILLILTLFLTSSVQAQNLTMTVSPEPTTSEVYLRVDFVPAGPTVGTAEEITRIEYVSSIPADFTFWSQSGGWMRANDNTRTTCYYPATSSTLYVRANVQSTRNFLSLINSNLGKFNLALEVQRQNAIILAKHSFVDVSDLSSKVLVLVQPWVIVMLIVGISIYLCNMMFFKKILRSGTFTFRG